MPTRRERAVAAAVQRTRTRIDKLIEDRGYTRHIIATKTSLSLYRWLREEQASITFESLLHLAHELEVEVSAFVPAGLIEEPVKSKKKRR